MGMYMVRVVISIRLEIMKYKIAVQGTAASFVPELVRGPLKKSKFQAHLIYVNIKNTILLIKVLDE